jgi:alkylation response protein AidB-like acyl-CoA dehydrogenase
MKETIAAAFEGGRAADRVAWAFAAGYQAALRALWPGAPEGKRFALCATEAQGAHPSQIATLLADGVLRGKKRFVTGGDTADVLLVVATTGRGDDGRNRLRVCAIDARRAGVTLRPGVPTPFAPELGHAALELDGVAVSPDEVLPGDGYTAWLKPFRTIEDLHVHAALCGYVIAVARRWRWPHAAVEKLSAIVHGLASLAAEDPLAPATHVALGGALALGSEILESCEPHWSLVEDEEVRARWRRDRPLLDIAGKVRALRLEAAWRALEDVSGGKTLPTQPSK